MKLRRKASRRAQVIRIAALGACAAIMLSESAGAEPAAPSEQEIAASAAYDQGDYVAAFHLIEPLAARGELRAQVDLAGLYYAGRGVPKDEGQAYRLSQAAAAQHYAPGELLLGVLYDLGAGTPRDHQQSDRWVKAAAAQGYAPAQYYLGAAAPFAALAGEGQTQETTEAMGWLRKAAEQGYAPAQLSLGLTYRAQRDDKGAQAEAARWFAKAAEQGDADAEAQLARMYQRGDGVPEDPARAIVLDRKAAEQGNLVAQAQLALLYAAGQGAAPDMVQAYMWAAVADEAAKGTPLAGMQSKLVGTMSEFAHVSATPEQIASGRQMAAEWVKRHPKPHVAPEDVVPMWMSVRN